MTDIAAQSDSAADGTFYAGAAGPLTLVLAPPAQGDVMCGACYGSFIEQAQAAGRLSSGHPLADGSNDDLEHDDLEHDDLEHDDLGEDDLDEAYDDELDGDVYARLLLDADLEDSPYPPSGQPGHSCAAAIATIPVWMARDGGCAASASEHLLTAPACECGLRTLSEVLDLLDVDSRQEALAAHLRALDALFDHCQAADRLSDGHEVEEYLAAACLDCLAHPLEHASLLDEALSSHLSQLGVALRMFRCQVAVGEARSARPGQ